MNDMPGMKGNIFEAYRRWRHRRGYGVHSPLAYRLVTEVITDLPRQYKYYDQSSHRGKEYRLLYRLAARFGAAGLLCNEDAAELCRAVAGDFRDMPVLSSPSDEGWTVVCLKGGISPDDYLHLVVRSKTIILMLDADHTVINDALTNMRFGVALADRRNAVIAVRSDVSKVVYGCRI